MNTWAKAGLWALGILVFLGLVGTGLFFLGGRLGLFSVVLGEEGYTSYDPLLAGNTFDSTKWVQEGGNCDGLAEPRSSSCAKQLGVPYSEVSVKDGVLVQSAHNSQAAGGQRSLRTTDLRLVNFKTEFQLLPGGVDGGKVCWYTYCFTDTSKRTRATSPVATLELVWDDYKEGHYQIKINGEVQEEGTVPEGTPFYLTKTPAADIGAQAWLVETMYWRNPRVKRVFGCDLQGGEVLAFKTIKGPDAFALSDLKGFRRFCIDHPSSFLNAGVSKTSKEIYYSLAAGEAVTVGTNQAWKVVYVADALRAGVPMNCEGVDVDRRSCGDLTGFADLGPSVVYVADKIDLTKDVGIANDEVLFNTNFKQTTVLGGLFTVKAPAYTCAGKDGYDTSDDLFFNYPEPRPECYTFTVNDVAFTADRADIDLDNYFDLNIDSAHANLCYCDGKAPGVKSPSTWSVAYRAKLKKPFVTNIKLRAKDASLGEQADGILTFTDKYHDFTGRVIVSTTSVATGETKRYTKDLDVTTGPNDLTIPLETDVLGDQDVSVTVYVATESDSLRVSEEYETSYTVTGTATTGTKQPSTGTPATPTAEPGFLERIMAAIAELFHQLFGGDA